MEVAAHRLSRCARLACALVLAIAATASLVAAQAASPTIEGPVSGGTGNPFVATSAIDLASVGYIQEEFFISGTATAYTSGTPLTSDGEWSLTPGASAAYKTRIVVYRPALARRFNGTVIVEWLNVSAGIDSGPDWLAGHVQLIRDGFAWVGVSAQIVGVEGGTAILGMPAPGLKHIDPARYGSLVHPGDSFSYDIFSQAGQAVRHPSGPNPLGDLPVERVIAVGESQSAFRLVPYINGVDALARVYDGYLVHSRSAGGAPLSEAPQPAIPLPRPTLFRTDARVPVLALQTETDVTVLNYYSDRQPDNEHFRLWEVAGTAHADTYTLAVGGSDLGRSPRAADLIVTTNPVVGFHCGVPVNSGPLHFVLNAAIVALNRWVKDGIPPAEAPRLATEGTPPSMITRDPYGNAVGGIRTPAVDAPIATLSGIGGGGTSFCFLFGSTVRLDAATLAVLYPTHAAYVAAVSRVAQRAMRNGFLLQRDARLIRAQAADSAIGR